MSAMATNDVDSLGSTEQEKRETAPKPITNAQTVCNEKNAKGKLCNGFLKQINTGGQEAAKHLRGDDVLFKCQTCGTLYMGPPLGHLRDPEKMPRVVQKELTAILQAAGGTLPAFTKSETGAWVLAEPREHKAPAKPGEHTRPSVPSTSGTDSSAQADAHRPAAEAQASTGLGPSVPLSPSAGTTSPAAGAETPEDLPPDKVKE